jgi:hypothetical protein
MTSDTPTTSTLPDGSVLPDVCSALLDEPTLAQLFSDIATCTRVVQILAKGAPQQMVAAESSLTLEQAQEMLRRRAVRGVQIRYLYDGGEWFDTLMTTPQGIRLARLRAPAS